LIFAFSVLAKRLAEKSSSEMTYIVSSGMQILNFQSDSELDIGENAYEMVKIGQSGLITHTHTQPFYGPFYGTTRVSRCQKRTFGLYGARGD